jgi:putative flippase GtrA
MGYVLVGGICAIANVAAFTALLAVVPPAVAAPAAFAAAAVLNYWLCVLTLFQRRERSARRMEIVAYAAVVIGVGGVDLVSTLGLLRAGVLPPVAKVIASAVALTFNFIGRRFLVFPERRPGPWAPADSRYQPSGQTPAQESGERIQASVEL